MSDVIQQVAEAKCPRCRNIDPKGLVWNHICDECQGIGLRWPPLSRECGSTFRSHVDRDLPCCNGSGRVADVTLEKVFAAARAEGVNHIAILYEEDRIQVIYTPESKSHYDDDLPFGLSDDLEKAACAALLVTVGITPR